MVFWGIVLSWGGLNIDFMTALYPQHLSSLSETVFDQTVRPHILIMESR